MSELYDSIRLTRSAATFTRALGIDAPDGADAPCDIVLDKLFAELGGDTAAFNMKEEVDPLEEMRVIVWFCDGEVLRFGPHQRRAVVIPMHRHGQRIAKERAEQTAALS